MNPEELAEYRRKEKRAAYMRQYYETHPEAREKKRAKERERAKTHAVEAQKRSRDFYRDNTEYVKKREAKRLCDAKVKAIALLGGKCQECGFAHPAALQFHHRDPETKLFNITTKQLTTPKRFPWEMIVAEVEKCDLLCANCHFTYHSVWDPEWFIEEAA